MDYETVSADEFGASLRGLGINLLVRDVKHAAHFLGTVFGMTAHRLSSDFAIMMYGNQVFQLHADHTYAGHPLQELLPENPPRGRGVQLHLFDTDPEHAASTAEVEGGVVLAAPTEKPHGLIETFILDPDGYCWVASRPK